MFLMRKGRNSDVYQMNVHVQRKKHKWKKNWKKKKKSKQISEMIERTFVIGNEPQQ